MPQFRTYHEVHGDDRSALLDQVMQQRRRVTARLAGVRRVGAVMSGKGGVGKSFVTAGLARALAASGEAVGVLDADVNGPTVARLLDAKGPVRITDGAAEPALGAEGVRVFSTDLLLEEDAPLRWRDPGSERFVWRGTLEAGALREFLSDVQWGTLDVLLVDLPPGAGALDDLAQLVPDLVGVLAVTIPTEESRRSVARAMELAREAKMRLLGVIENMSGYACPGCGATHPLFPGDAGAQLSEKFGVPLLGRIPFSPSTSGGLRGALAAPIPEALLGAVLGAFQ